MKLAEIRKKFLNYFESKNHEIINSSDLVPKGLTAYFLRMLVWFSSKIRFWD